MASQNTYLLFGLIVVTSILITSNDARQLPAHFFSLYEIPDEFFRDEQYFKEKIQKSEEQIDNYRKNLRLFKELNQNDLLRDLRARSSMANRNRANFINDDPVQQQIADTSSSSREIQPQQLQMPQNVERNAAGAGVKDSSVKKNNNNYYMSVCHFKICNMGRKRNIRRIPSSIPYLNHLAELQNEVDR